MIARPQDRTATYQDLLDAPDGTKAELMDGTLCTSPQPTWRHQRAATAIASLLRMRFEQYEQGGPGQPGDWWIVHHPEVHLVPERRVVVPDVAGWRRARMPNPPRDTHIFSVAPDWVCEVLSPATKSWDAVVKMPAYAAAGVSWAWLVEPAERRVDAFQLEAGRWQPVAGVEAPISARLPPFAATELPVASWWLPDPT